MTSARNQENSRPFDFSCCNSSNAKRSAVCQRRSMNVSWLFLSRAVALLCALASSYYRRDEVEVAHARRMLHESSRRVETFPPSSEPTYLTAPPTQEQTEAPTYLTPAPYAWADPTLLPSSSPVSSSLREPKPTVDFPVPPRSTTPTAAATEPPSVREWPSATTPPTYVEQTIRPTAPSAAPTSAPSFTGQPPPSPAPYAPVPSPTTDRTFSTDSPTEETISPTVVPSPLDVAPTAASASNTPTFPPSTWNVPNPKTSVPSFEPTATPKVSMAPTPVDRALPSFGPIYNPTYQPTENPIRGPTYNPTSSHQFPSRDPTYSPTWDALDKKTSVPTYEPTYKPTLTTWTKPTPMGSEFPSYAPTYIPTSPPKYFPTRNPTYSPRWDAPDKRTSVPTYEPTYKPTPVEPSLQSYAPTHTPTYQAPDHLIYEPTYEPTPEPTPVDPAFPSYEPTYNPTFEQTQRATKIDPAIPTAEPTYNPAPKPAHDPTSKPTEISRYKPTSADPGISPTPYEWPNDETDQSSAVPMPTSYEAPTSSGENEPFDEVPAASLFTYIPSYTPTVCPSLKTNSPIADQGDESRSPPSSTIPEDSDAGNLQRAPSALPTTAPPDSGGQGGQNGLTEGPSYSPTLIEAAVVTSPLNSDSPTLGPTNAQYVGETGVPSTTTRLTNSPTACPTTGEAKNNSSSHAPLSSIVLSETVLPSGVPSTCPTVEPSMTTARPPAPAPTLNQGTELNEDAPTGDETSDSGEGFLSSRGALIAASAAVAGFAIVALGFKLWFAFV